MSIQWRRALRRANLPASVERRLLAALLSHVERRHSALVARYREHIDNLASFRDLLSDTTHREVDPHWRVHLARVLAEFVRDLARADVRRGKVKDRSETKRLIGEALQLCHHIESAQLVTWPAEGWRIWLAQIWKMWRCRDEPPWALLSALQTQPADLVALRLLAERYDLDLKTLRARLHKAGWRRLVHRRSSAAEQRRILGAMPLSMYPPPHNRSRDLR